MVNAVKKLILHALGQMLAAIIRIALRNGVSFLEFSELSKSLYVRIAAEDYGIRGRATNDSRIALITGINRREIRKLKEKDDSPDNTASNNVTLMSRIITAWHESERYTDASNQPALLTLAGNSPNFTELVQEYGGDMAAVTLLKEFKRSHVIEETAAGELKAIKPYYIPNYLPDTKDSPDFVSPDAISFGSSMLVDHINTIFFNLYASRENNKPKRMELRAVNSGVKKSKVPAFYDYADELSLDYLQKIDKWLLDNEAVDSETLERVGVGLYFIEGANKA